MQPQFTEEQKKKIRAQVTLAAAIGLVAGIVSMFLINKKHIDKLEAKIFKLEGWQ